MYYDMQIYKYPKIIIILIPKVMKKLNFFNILIAINITILAVIISCEGPEGPMGSQGQQGAAGPQGVAGSSCCVVDNGDGTFTIHCESSVTIVNDTA